jgi:hypothetical protein
MTENWSIFILGSHYEQEKTGANQLIDEEVTYFFGLWPIHFGKN